MRIYELVEETAAGADAETVAVFLESGKSSMECTNNALQIGHLGEDSVIHCEGRVGYCAALAATTGTVLQLHVVRLTVAR